MAFENKNEEVLKQLKYLSENYFKKSAIKTDSENKWPAENVKLLQESGLGGMLIPKEHGGHGLGLLSLAMACEIIGSACASTSMCFGMHLVGSAVMNSKATDEQKEMFLRPIAEGKHWTTLALSEPGTGSHFYIPQMQMQQHQNKLILNGCKSFVTNGSYADSYVMSVVGPAKENSTGEFSCVIVPKNSKGLKWGSNWQGIGMRGNSSISVTVDHVEIPKENLLGNIGDQIWYVFEVVAPNFLIAMSGTYLGIAQAALNEATEHLKKRHYSHSGETLASYQVLQHRLGILWAKVESTRQLIYSAASQVDTGHPSSLLSVMAAKAEVADCVVNVVNESMTLMGGESYAHSSEMHRHLRDARAAHVMAPTTDLLRTWTGRSLLGLPLLGS